MRISLTVSLAVMFLFCSHSVQAACEEEVTIEDLMEAARAGEDAFANMDHVILLQARDKALSILSCLDEPVSVVDAAAFHRLMALAAFTVPNEARVLSEFHAARKLRPGYSIPERVAPAGHPLVDLYERSAEADDGELQPVQVYEPIEGYASVGGVRGAARPKLTPVIIQIFTKHGDVVETRYLLPGETLPQWGLPPLAMSTLEQRRQRLEDPKPWLVGALISWGIAGAFYAASMHQHDRFLDLENPVLDDELRGYRDRANAFGGMAIGAGAISVGLTSVTITFGAKRQKKIRTVARD